MVSMDKRNELTEKQQKIIAGIAFGVFLLMMGLLGWFIGVPVYRFVKQPELFRAWVDSAGVWGRLAYVGMVIVQILVALIPGEAMEIAGGYAFGALEGTLLCLAAAGAGSLIVFGLVRRFGVRLVEVFFSLEKLRSLRFLKASKKRDFLFLLVFMLPGTPKDLLCYFAGLTDIKFGPWLLICTLGRIPSIITSTIGGDALGEERYLAAVLVFVLTFAISGAGLVLYNKLKENNKDGE